MADKKMKLDRFGGLQAKYRVNFVDVERLKFLIRMELV